MSLEIAIREIAEKLLVQAATQLPVEVEEVIHLAEEKENDHTAKAQLQTIVRNLDIAKQKKLSICQDPGIPAFEVNIGSEFPLNVDFDSIFTAAVQKVARELPLRQNVVHPLTKDNPGTNTGWGVPYIYYGYCYGRDYLEITALLRGGGSAFRSGVVTLAPTMPRAEGVKKVVFDFVTMAGGIPCPPTTIGVGVGGNPDMALNLAFKALKRLPPGRFHPDPAMAELEKDLFNALNKTGIGTMGLGGDTTVLAVHMECCGSHTASIPVAVAFSCWPNRFATARFYKSGKIEWITHRGENGD
ncbi:MAG: fumarate hydratase [Bacillota bacterium]